KMVQRGFDAKAQRGRGNAEKNHAKYSSAFLCEPLGPCAAASKKMVQRDFDAELQRGRDNTEQNLVESSSAFLCEPLRLCAFASKTDLFPQEPLRIPREDSHL